MKISVPGMEIIISCCKIYLGLKRNFIACVNSYVGMTRA